MKNRGFTLIELMIVLAIIGIILAVVIPAFTGQRAPTHNQSAGYEIVESIKNAPADICSQRAAKMKLESSFDYATGCTVKVGDRFVPIEQVRFDLSGQTAN